VLGIGGSFSTSLGFAEGGAETVDFCDGEQVGDWIGGRVVVQVGNGLDELVVEAVGAEGVGRGVQRTPRFLLSRLNAVRWRSQRNGPTRSISGL
jgi:hypothetical protein